MLAASNIFKIITDRGEQLGLPAGDFGGSGEAPPLDGTHEHSGAVALMLISVCISIPGAEPIK